MGKLTDPRYDLVPISGTVGGLEYVLTYQVEDLAAGADISNRTLFIAPVAYEVMAASIVGQAASAGIDGSNTCVIALKKNNSGTIVTKTYNAVTTFPAQGTVDGLGTIATDGSEDLASTNRITLDVTNGATADPPSFLIVIRLRTALNN